MENLLNSVNFLLTPTMGNPISEQKKKRISYNIDQGKSINQTSKDLNVSRPTVRKYSDYNYDKSEFSGSVEAQDSSGKNPENVVEDYQDDVETSSEPEEDEVENICGNCGEKFNGTPQNCPGCDAELNWEHVIEV